MGYILVSSAVTLALMSGFYWWRVYERGTGRAIRRYIDRATVALRARIEEDGFDPDIVLSVGRGGLLVGRMLIGKFGLSSLSPFHARYDWRFGNLGGHHLSHPKKLDLTGLRVLLVIGAVDTGETLREAFKHTSSKRPRAVRTASIFKVQTADFTPDYYVYQIKSSQEIPPWP